MKSVADKTGAQFIKSENWGRKKLAYEVRRERKGTYVYFYFKAPNNTVGELERCLPVGRQHHQVFDGPPRKGTGAAAAAEAPSEEFDRWPDLTKLFSSGISRAIRNCDIRRTERRWPSLGLAVSRRYKQGDELKEEVCFVDIVVFGKQAEHCGQYLSKGNGIIVDGRLTAAAVGNGRRPKAQQA